MSYKGLVKHLQYKFKESEYLNYFGVIYKITNLINNKIYIGQTIHFKERIRSHEETAVNVKSKSYNNPLYKAFRKYGIENFSIEIICLCDSIENLNFIEIKFIQDFQSSIDLFGYNLDLGGHNGLKSEYTKMKIKKALSGEKSIHFGKRGGETVRAIKIINLKTLHIYNSMLECAIEEYLNPKILKLLSKVTNLNNNRMSYKNNYYARIENNKILIKSSVAKILNINCNANGKSYISLTIDLLKRIHFLRDPKALKWVAGNTVRSSLIENV